MDDSMKGKNQTIFYTRDEIKLFQYCALLEK